MSLNFQLARGGIALAFVALFGVAAWLAPAPTSSARAAWVAETQVVAVACPVPVMRLASAPADLPKTRRLLASCRA